MHDSNGYRGAYAPGQHLAHAQEAHHALGCWVFRRGHEKRAHELGFIQPEQILLSELRGDGSPDDVQLGWLTGHLDKYHEKFGPHEKHRTTRHGTAKEHLRNIRKERELLGGHASEVDSGVVPSYPIDSDGRLTEHRVFIDGLNNTQGLQLLHQKWLQQGLPPSEQRVSEGHPQNDAHSQRGFAPSQQNVVPPPGYIGGNPPGRMAALPVSQYVMLHHAAPSTGHASTILQLSQQNATGTFQSTSTPLKHARDNDGITPPGQPPAKRNRFSSVISDTSSTTHALQAPPTQNQFFHALCGKALKSRRGVKAHHWGNKLDDLDTKTGCWFKHGKPSNVNWDDHPSCRDTPSNVSASNGFASRPATFSPEVQTFASYEYLQVPRLIESESPETLSEGSPAAPVLSPQSIPTVQSLPSNEPLVDPQLLSGSQETESGKATPVFSPFPIPEVQILSSHEALQVPWLSGAQGRLPELRSATPVFSPPSAPALQIPPARERLMDPQLLSTAQATIPEVRNATPVFSPHSTPQLQPTSSNGTSQVPQLSTSQITLTDALPATPVFTPVATPPLQIPADDHLLDKPVSNVVNDQKVRLADEDVHQVPRIVSVVGNTLLQPEAVKNQNARLAGGDLHQNAQSPRILSTRGNTLHQPEAVKNQNARVDDTGLFQNAQAPRIVPKAGAARLQPKVAYTPKYKNGRPVVRTSIPARPAAAGHTAQVLNTPTPLPDANPQANPSTLLIATSSPQQTPHEPSTSLLDMPLPCISCFEPNNTHVPDCYFASPTLLARIDHTAANLTRLANAVEYFDPERWRCHRGPPPPPELEDHATKAKEMADIIRNEEGFKGDAVMQKLHGLDDNALLFVWAAMGSRKVKAEVVWLDDGTPYVLEGGSEFEFEEEGDNSGYEGGKRGGSGEEKNDWEKGDAMEVDGE